ncbi:ATP phosphoribosyltransferase [Arachis hypogaea]|nr:ATP phosphoribosyltransferase [Arachis hypogaea]
MSQPASAAAQHAAIARTTRFQVTANMKGSSAKEVVERVLSQTIIIWVAGTHYKSCFLEMGWEGNSRLLCLVISVPKKALYKSIQ